MYFYLNLSEDKTDFNFSLNKRIMRSYFDVAKMHTNSETKKKNELNYYLFPVKSDAL